MIRESLLEAGVPHSEFGFTPFPIETPTHLPLFLPTHVRCFTTICEEWNREKIEVLKGAGYQVEVLWEREPKTVTGSAIRESLVRGDESWRAMVPASVVRAVERLNLAARLRAITFAAGSE
jgi:hypothetical protein